MVDVRLGRIPPIIGLAAFMALAGCNSESGSSDGSDGGGESDKPAQGGGEGEGEGEGGDPGLGDADGEGEGEGEVDDSGEGEGAEEEEPNQGDDDGAGDEGAAGEGEGEGEGEPQGPLCTGADPTGAPILDRSAVPPNCGRPAATCPGAPMPYWQLADFQPQSCGFEEVYSLDAFVGTRTVVALFAAS